MENLLKETIETVSRYRFRWPEDVNFIAAYEDCKPVEIPITLFEEKANHEYDNDYGSIIVDDSLVIVMKNGDYFVRDSYDGSEWWEFRPTHIVRPQELVSLDFNLFPWEA